MKKFLNWYQTNFAVAMPIMLMIVLALFMEKIPYVNLFSHFFSTLALTVSLFGVLSFLEQSLNLKLKALLVLVAMSYVLYLLSFAYQSEIVGNVFYIYLFYVAIIEAKQLQ